MESHLKELIQDHKKNGKLFTLQKAFEELSLKDTFCCKLIKPINAVAIGEYYNRNSSERNAVIAVLDQKFRGTFADATARIACRVERRIDSLCLLANSQCLCSPRVPKILFFPSTGLRKTELATFAAQELTMSTSSKSKTANCQKVFLYNMC